MKRFLLILTACFFPLGSSAEEKMEDLYFPKTDVRDVMDFYGFRVRKPVFVRNGFVAHATIIEKNVPAKDVPELIRKTLLEKYGIAVRETKDGEVLVDWSTDPDFPRRSEDPHTKAERKTLPRLRAINNEGVPIPR